MQDRRFIFDRADLLAWVLYLAGGVAAIVLSAAFPEPWSKYLAMLIGSVA